MRVESETHRSAARRLGLRALQCCLAAAVLTGSGCPVQYQPPYAEPVSEAGLLWADPSGDTSKQTLDAAVAKCKDEIKAATTDQIQQIPKDKIEACLKAKGWVRVLPR